MIHAFALALASLVAPQVVQDGSPAKPGAIGIYDQTLTVNGCMAFVNNDSALKRTGKCTFDVVLFGLQLDGMKCKAKVAGNDTIFTCTYPPTLQVGGK